jgi:VIT1/CCC1 family predicted Fe2+/Mn2+ transporter
VLPILAVVVAPASLRVTSVALVCLLSLGMLGALGGYLGGAPMTRASVRVMLGGWAAMGVTALMGYLLRVAGIG